MITDSIYDKSYYENWGTVGESYHDSESLVRFFNMVAERLIEQYHPKTVIDFGCAMGHLVAAFRARGVEAYGIDISEYAISQVSDSIMPYCKVCSILEELPEDFPKHFDLGITIEVIEHLVEEDAIPFINNISKYTDRLVFSSTSKDVTDKTHFNVQQIEYWAKRFAMVGFYKDLQNDTKFLSPDAECFYKDNLEKYRLVENYERKIRIDNIADLEQKNIANKLAEGNEFLSKKYDMQVAQIAELETQIERIPELELQAPLSRKLEKQNFQQVAQIAELETQIERIPELELQASLSRKLEKQNFQLQNRIKEIEELYFHQWESYSAEIHNLKSQNCDLSVNLTQKEHEFNAINSSKAYRLVIRLRKVKNFLFPPQSKWGKFCRLIYHIPSFIRKGYLRKLVRYIKVNGFRGLKKRMSREFSSPSVIESLGDYNIWISYNEPSENEIMLQRLAAFRNQPLISIVVPAYNTPIPFLDALIQSIQDQTYKNWELCIADGNSNNQEEIKEALNKYDDDRIKYCLCEENLGISGNTNAAIDLSSGEYIAFVDHDDTIPPFALYEVVNCINRCSGVDFIYSDDDRISVVGERSAPCFKPDFSIDRIRTCNYIGHLSVLKKNLLEDIGLLNSEYDGSQDYDLVLRATEKAERIEHIPKILYHWRMHENSVCMNANSKTYAYDAAKKAIEAHLKRVGIVGKVSDGYITNSYKIDYLIKDDPKISIIIPTMDHISELKTCLDSILKKTTYKNYEIVLVENNSSKFDTFEYYNSLSSIPQILVVERKDKGFNYSALINYGVEKCSGEYVITLNNDTEIITPNWIEEMLMFAQREDVGMVGPRLLYPDDTVWNTGVVLDLKRSVTLLHNRIDKNESGYYGQSVIVQNFSALAGACIMFRKDFYIYLGGCDEITFPVAHNDMDLSLKMIQKGKVLVYTPFAQLYHYESKSRGSDMEGDNLHRFLIEDQMFLKKWEDYLKYGDPYYNVNLKVGENNFQIRTEKVSYKY